MLQSVTKGKEFLSRHVSQALPRVCHRYLMRAFGVGWLNKVEVPKMMCLGYFCWPSVE